MPRLADLQEARAAASGKMRALLDTADSETRDLSDDEDKQFKTLKAEISTLDRKIERARDLAEAERAAPAILHNGRGDGSFEQRAREFSVVKALRAAIGDGVDAGFEREISAETERRCGRKAKGILVPDAYFQERRALGDNVMLTSGVGANLYPTQHRADSLSTAFAPPSWSGVSVPRFLMASSAPRTSPGRPAARPRNGFRKTVRSPTRR